MAMARLSRVPRSSWIWSSCHQYGSSAPHTQHEGARCQLRPVVEQRTTSSTAAHLTVLVGQHGHVRLPGRGSLLGLFQQQQHAEQVALVQRRVRRAELRLQLPAPGRRVRAQRRASAGHRTSMRAASVGRAGERHSSLAILGPLQRASLALRGGERGVRHPTRRDALPRTAPHCLQGAAQGERHVSCARWCCARGGHAPKGRLIVAVDLLAMQQQLLGHLDAGVCGQVRHAHDTPRVLQLLLRSPARAVAAPRGALSEGWCARDPRAHWRTARAPPASMSSETTNCLLPGARGTSLLTLAPCEAGGAILSGTPVLHTRTRTPSQRARARPHPRPQAATKRVGAHPLNRPLQEALHWPPVSSCCACGSAHPGGRRRLEDGARGPRSLLVNILS